MAQWAPILIGRGGDDVAADFRGNRRGAAASASLLAAPAEAAPRCRNTGSFEAWLAAFKQEAAAQGISRQAISAALDGVTFDPAIIRRDSGQGVFQQSFLQFAGRMTGGRALSERTEAVEGQRGAAVAHRAAHRRAAAPWWSRCGAWKATTAPTRAASTTSSARSRRSAYDCRRSEFFRDQLMGAVRIVERGDLRPEEMIGNWAGELGPTQFTPSDYFKHGVDFDGDGRVDMIHSVPDALASAANLMKSFGWQKGQPWLQEVRVPARDAVAGVRPRQPASALAMGEWGVTAAHGQLPADNLPASLILPMGRLGPAFLAYPNFKAYIEWNAAIVYSTTAAYFGTRLAGAPPVGPGNGQPVVPTTEQIQELQRLLIARQMLTGEADGRLGSATRAGGQAGADQGRAAGGCLSDPGADRAAAGGAVAHWRDPSRANRA